MYNNNFNDVWDSVIAEKSKKVTLGLIGIAVINLILSAISAFSINAETIAQRLITAPGDVSQFNWAKENIQMVRIVTIVISVIYALIIISLLWGKIRKLDQAIVPSRGVYFWLAITGVLGLLNINNFINNGAIGIVSLVLLVASVALSIIAITEVGKLKKAYIHGRQNNQDFYRGNVPMKDNMENNNTPENVVFNAPENIEPNYNSNTGFGGQNQQMIPNHQPVNNLDRNQLLDVDPQAVDVKNTDVNEVPTNEDPRSNL